MTYGNPALNLSGVSKVIQGRTVLADVSLTVPAGQACAIAGLNGAGKTTLLHGLMDFVPMTTGRLDIFGRPHTDPQARRELFFLPERFMPPGHLSAHEVLVWLAGLRGQVWRREQTRAGLTQWGLDAQAIDRPLRYFSKGMTQKTGLLAALLSGVPLLVLDEPMSGLDPQARRFVLEGLKAAKAQGRTVVLTSHAMPHIAALCDQLVVLHQGRVRFAGHPDALCAAWGGGELEDAFLALLDHPEAA